MQITDQRDKIMSKKLLFNFFWNFLLFYCKKSKFKFSVSQIIAIFGRLRILPEKVPCSLGSKHGRLREAAWRGRKIKRYFFENCIFRPFFHLWRSPAPWRWGLRATYQVLLPGEFLPHLERGHRSPGLPSVPSHSVPESSRPGRAPLSRRHW